MRNRNLLLVSALVFAAVLAAYSNHFHNSFHFDDFHTVSGNPYVRDLRNIPRFFTDARTFSTLPDHQSYRPLVSLSLAIDYALGGGNLLWFHLSTFFWFLVQLVLMYLLFESVMDAAAPHPHNRWFALFAAALFGLHPVSAETVNYIIQRAEIYCSVGVIAGVVLYIRLPHLRQTGLYLVPPVLAILSKPPAAIFPLILFVYILLFEEKGDLARAARRTVPAFGVCLLAGIFVVTMVAPTFQTGGGSPWLYRLTQPSITWHYFRSFFWPSDLTADSDFTTVERWSDARVLEGLLFLAALGIAAWRTAQSRRTRPIAFGIAWLLLALLPVAWVPLAEVENDHRMFFAFVGLTLAAVWTVRLAAGEDLRSLAAAAALVLVVCAYGTHQRNEVWRTEETLWQDVAEKSPHNGRGLMNHGLTLMSKGDSSGALAVFEKALVLTPNYSLLHINMGIANGALGRDAEARGHFIRAMALAPADSQSYCYFAGWLSQRGQPAQATSLAETGLQKNANDMQCRTLLLQLYRDQGNAAKFDGMLAQSLQIAPHDPDLLRFQAPKTDSPAPQTPEGYLSLSLSEYQAKRYVECINAAKEAVRLKPDYAEAYNNIAAGWIALGRYEQGIQAAKEALRLKPDFQLAHNNLEWAQWQLSHPK